RFDLPEVVEDEHFGPFEVGAFPARPEAGADAVEEVHHAVERDAVPGLGEAPPGRDGEVRLAVTRGPPHVQVGAELEGGGRVDRGVVAGVNAESVEGVGAVAGGELVGEGGDLALGFLGVPVLEGGGAVDVVRVAGVLRYPGDSDPCGVAHVASEGWV